MGSMRVNRRRFVAGTAAASAALVAAPFVRSANAAGKLSVGFWDHWVPGANKAEPVEAPGHAPVPPGDLIAK